MRRIQEVLKNKLSLPSRIAAKKAMLTKETVKKWLVFLQKVQALEGETVEEGHVLEKLNFKLVKSRGAKV